jgi:BirA family transcriptional regulator, biotin operon repressor / biotin---[acetyl-CoA-carboxylase] ligase
MPYHKAFKTSLLKSILTLLVDGSFHSAQEISKILDIPYTVVPEILKFIAESSINLEVINDKNYCLADSLELLDASHIYNELGEVKQLLSQLEVLTLIDSTNSYLLNKRKYKGNYAVFAEQQTAGRGQFNRTWFSNFGKDIALSLLWEFSKPLNKLAGLTLVVGIAIVKALEEYGLKGIQLKWPNDIIHEGKKLGGILTETQSRLNKIQKIVIGIGLNLYNPKNHSLLYNQTATSVSSLENLPPRRNLLAILILKNLLHILIEFKTKDFCYFLSDWHRLDYLAGKKIILKTSSQPPIEGIAKGINSQGQLCVKIKNKYVYFNNGEIQVKLKTEN